MGSSRSAAGFTLIELMVVIAILAIVLSIGVPSFTNMVKNNRLTSAANDMVAMLQFARSEAVRRGRNVQVSAVSGDVEQGLMVWFDDNGNGSYDTGEELRKLSDIASTLEVSAAIDGADAAGLDLGYNSQGAVSGSGSELKISLCDDRSGEFGKQLRLLASGMLRLSGQVSC